MLELPQEQGLYPRTSATTLTMQKAEREWLFVLTFLSQYN